MKPARAVVCAHRGASGTHPENTLPAFRRAVELRCEMVEFDVRMTADAVPFILHDPTVNRTTNGSGEIWTLTSEQVRKLEAGAKFNPAFAGTRIPTLPELLDALPPGVELNIHVYPGPNDGEVVVRNVCQEIRRRGRYESAFVAGSEEVMDWAMAADEKVRRCLLGSQNDAESYLKRCLDYGCYAMQPTNGITSPALCQSAHAAGLKVNPFYADDETEMQRLIDCGVDGILTNVPERMITLLQRLNLR